MDAKAVFLTVVFVVILAFVFLPWLNRFIDGQLYGESGDYGTDFFRYSRGAVAAIDLEIDPYSNEQMLAAFEQGQLSTDHPNPSYDEQMAKKSFEEPDEPVAKGVVSPPFVLVVMYPLVRLLGYTLAFQVWTIGSLVAIALTCVLFTRQFLNDSSRGRRYAVHAAMLALLVFAGFPVLWSLLYGQFEGIYVPAMGVAIYLWSFARDRAFPLRLCGILIAVATSIKAFPIVLLAYFGWLLVQTWRLSPDRVSARRLLALPEARVLVWSGLGLLGIGLLTGSVLGFDIYESFLRKVADLQVEGTGPSMKGNLASYLNFVPVWIQGPFTAMTGNMAFLYAIVAAITIVVIGRTIRPREGDLSNRSWIRCLELTLILAAMPTVLPHWWIYYNVVLILPLLCCFLFALHHKRTGMILSLTIGGFVLTFSYLTTTLFFDAFPVLYDLLINRAAVNEALQAAAREPLLMQNLPYSASLGQAYVAEFEGRVISLLNLLYGYPGTICLLLANALALQWLYRRAEVPAESAPAQSVMPRRHALFAMLSGVALSFVGGAGLVWEARRRLRGQLSLWFIVDEHALEDPRQFSSRLVERVRHAKTHSMSAQVGGLVSDALPPDHFLQWLESKDAAAAEAIREQNRQYFADQARSEQVQARFEEYQIQISLWYVRAFQAGDPEEFQWRDERPIGGLRHDLELACLDNQVPLRRLAQQWSMWQLTLLFETAWDRAWQAWKEGDPVAFTRAIYEHQMALTEHEAALDRRYVVLRESLPTQFVASDWRPLFVYIQQPTYVALSFFPLCQQINLDTQLETVVQVGSRYLIEEAIRQQRLEQYGRPYEALQFARSLVEQVTLEQIQAWWAPGRSITPQEILEETM